MNKRQRKKREKKYLPVIADEYNLLTMNEQEREEAWKEYYKFRKRYAFCKTYKELKEGKPLRYYFPCGEQYNKFISQLSRSCSSLDRNEINPLD